MEQRKKLSVQLCFDFSGVFSYYFWKAGMKIVGIKNCFFAQNENDENFWDIVKIFQQKANLNLNNFKALENLELPEIKSLNVDILFYSNLAFNLQNNKLLEHINKSKCKALYLDLWFSTENEFELKYKEKFENLITGLKHLGYFPNVYTYDPAKFGYAVTRYSKTIIAFAQESSSKQFAEIFAEFSSLKRTENKIVEDILEEKSRIFVKSAIIQKMQPNYFRGLLQKRPTSTLSIATLINRDYIWKPLINNFVLKNKEIKLHSKERCDCLDAGLDSFLKLLSDKLSDQSILAKKWCIKPKDNVFEEKKLNSVTFRHCFESFDENNVSEEVLKLIETKLFNTSPVAPALFPIFMENNFSVTEDELLSLHIDLLSGITVFGQKGKVFAPYGSRFAASKNPFGLRSSYYTRNGIYWINNTLRVLTPNEIFKAYELPTKPEVSLLDFSFANEFVSFVQIPPFIEYFIERLINVLD
ncbi:hypothetical protein [Mycoplasmopsis columbinasalis]|uniref:Uncharacterized protein n=1 Tax=Mycoplasmopsis columbinasalis TaxID=114880 RepID=A0A449BAD5_9BACT|nr:hypothetical protein [Mycoplasmopsis columbinasalis]VEU78171.1 Uncharacterised protein [Mycoplasmopsis columbinasalis]